MTEPERETGSNVRERQRHTGGETDRDRDTKTFKNTDKQTNR